MEGFRIKKEKDMDILKKRIDIAIKSKIKSKKAKYLEIRKGDLKWLIIIKEC